MKNWVSSNFGKYPAISKAAPISSETFRPAETAPVQAVGSSVLGNLKFAGAANKPFKNMHKPISLDPFRGARKSYRRAS